MLLVLLTIDVIITTLWTALDPIILRHNILVSPSSVLLLFRSCCSQFGIGWWVIIVMSIRVGQLVVMVVLSLLTRCIPNKNFTTSSLQVFSYICLSFFALGFLLYYFTFKSIDQNIDNTQYPNPVLQCVCGSFVHWYSLFVLNYRRLVYCSPHSQIEALNSSDHNDVQSTQLLPSLYTPISCHFVVCIILLYYQG